MSSLSPTTLAIALLLSCGGLALGPLLLLLGRGRAPLGAAIDGLTLGLVPTVILARLMPHVFESLGLVAVGLAAFAYLALWFFDRAQHRAATRLGDTMILTALLAHACTDGVSLASAIAATRGLGSGNTLPLLAALLVHRLPEGLFIATTLVPRLGWPRAIARLGLIALTTIGGALFGGALLERLPDQLFDGALALGLGAMLRLVVHSHAAPSTTAATRALTGLGFLAGVAAAVVIPAPHDVLRAAQPRELSVVQSLGPLFVETAPSLLLGLLVAGLAHTYLPRQVVGWLAGGTRLRQSLRGTIFGIPLPICSCGVLPLVRGFARQAVPAAAVVAFAVGAPELGLDSVLLSLRLLGLPLTVARFLASALLAIGVGWLVGRFARPSETSPLPGGKPQAHASVRGAARLAAALREGLVFSLDHAAAWYVVGLLLAATIEAAVSPTLLSSLPFPIDMFAAVLVAIPSYVCAQGATPLAAVFLHKGLSASAVLAFLLAGPPTNFAVLAVLGRTYGRRAALWFALGIVGGALLLGGMLGSWIPPESVPAIHALVAHDHGRLEWAAAAVLLGLLILSLLRHGPRAWFANLQLLGEPSGHAGHTHDVPQAGARSHHA